MLLARENPAAVKYALGLLGFMRADTRLPLVEPETSAKAEIAKAIAAIGEDDLTCDAWEENGHQRSAQI
jgi:4-hydroxy-tetrahydrodipicolinate synthase